MFDIGWSELLIIGAVALIAIGPKELPGALRALGHWMGKVRRMASEFQGQFQEAMREAEMADLKKQVEEATSAANSIAHFDPLDGVRQEVDKMQDDLNKALEEKPGETTATEPAAEPAVATSDPGAIVPTAPAEPPVLAPEPAPATADQPPAPPKLGSGERP